MQMFSNYVIVAAMGLIVSGGCQKESQDGAGTTASKRPQPNIQRGDLNPSHFGLDPAVLALTAIYGTTATGDYAEMRVRQSIDKVGASETARLMLSAPAVLAAVLNHAFQVMLNRPATQAEHDLWIPILQSGEGDPLKVAFELANSSEFAAVYQGPYGIRDPRGFLAFTTTRLLRYLTPTGVPLINRLTADDVIATISADTIAEWRISGADHIGGFLLTQAGQVFAQYYLDNLPGASHTAAHENWARTPTSNLLKAAVTSLLQQATPAASATDGDPLALSSEQYSYDDYRGYAAGNPPSGMDWMTDVGWNNYSFATPAIPSSPNSSSGRMVPQSSSGGTSGSSSDSSSDLTFNPNGPGPGSGTCPAPPPVPPAGGGQCTPEQYVQKCNEIGIPVPLCDIACSSGGANTGGNPPPPVPPPGGGFPANCVICGYTI